MVHLHRMAIANICLLWKSSENESFDTQAFKVEWDERWCFKEANSSVFTAGLYQQK